MLAINKLAEERDQALMDRANGDMATVTRNHYERLIKERNEARDMVENLTDHGLNLMDSNRMLKCERDEAREALREIQAADWKTAGELRGMARKVLEAAK